MAENENGQEKTEQPTSKRLNDAREKGQVPRSRELNTTVMLLAGAAGLLIFGGGLGEGLAEMMTDGLNIRRGLIFESELLPRILGTTLLDALVLVLPFLAIALAATFAPPMLIGGFSISSKALTPQLSRLNPISGTKKLFSANGLVELAKALVKVVLVVSTSWLVIDYVFADLMSLGSLSVQGAIARTFQIVGWGFLAISCCLILVAAVDVPYQVWHHKRELRMTKKEVEEESKNTEGNPEVKGRIRRVQQEVAMRRMMSEVPAADVVVTNPTHFAVALKYDDKNMGAPRVVAKGADLVAGQIRTIARENNVPLFSAPPLARALFYSTELNQEIPAGLYLAVAQVLAYVYQLKVSIYGSDPRPAPPTDLDVPEEFLRRDRERRQSRDQDV